MRRTWWFRHLATLLTLWFPLVVGEPSMLHPCPTHGAAMVASATTAAHHQAASAHASHQLSEAPTSSQAPGHDHHNCTCIGCCAGSAAVVPEFEGATTSFEAVAYDVGRAPSHVEATPRSPPAFSRPYTTGPPRA